MGRVFIPTSESFPETADAVVIGGGIVGVATAFWLSRAGLDTVLVEMRDGLSTLTTPQSIECFLAQAVLFVTTRRRRGQRPVI